MYAVAPPTRGARFLIAMLFVDGLAVITSYENNLYVNPFLESLGLPVMQPVLHQVSDWALVAIYLPFLGMTLNSPLVKPLKHPLISRIILVGGLGFAVLLFFLPYSTLEQFRVPFYVVIVIVLAWGFAAAIHSWYIATNDAERDRARAFTIAFGVRDVLWTFTFTLNVLSHYAVIGDGAWKRATEVTELQFFVPFLYELAVIIYVPLVAYGVLRVQLFAVDLLI